MMRVRRKFNPITRKTQARCLGLSSSVDKLSQGLPNKSIILILYPPVKLLPTTICGYLGCVINKAQRQGKNLPPIADSCISSERINYADNSHIVTNLDCIYAPMRLIATIVAGVFFCLNLKRLSRYDNRRDV